MVANNLILSAPKSGRTWLSYLYAYYAVYCLAGARAEQFIDEEFTPTAHIYRPLEHPGLSGLLKRGEPHGWRPVRAAHHFAAQPYFQLRVELFRVKERSVVFLVRDPRDVVVSYFHHTMQRAGRALAHGKPSLSADVNLSEFLRSETHGIRAIVAYMNQVMKGGPKAFEQFNIVAFEDLVTNTADVFAGVLRWFGAPVHEDALIRAVTRASFEKLQRIEIARRVRKQVDPLALDALRFRRGIPGGFRSELNLADISYLDRVIECHLSPELGRYRSSSCNRIATPFHRMTARLRTCRKAIHCRLVARKS